MARPPIAIVDTETTGLYPELHDVFEIAARIVRFEDADESTEIAVEKDAYWTLPVDLGRADPNALRVNRYYERVAERDLLTCDPGDVRGVVADIAMTLAGCTLIGAVPSFDERFLTKLLRDNGQCPAWHYQPVDVETLAAGYLHGVAAAIDRFSVPAGPNDPARGALQVAHTVGVLPYDSEQLSLAVGVNPGDFRRHSAAGDVDWACAIWKAVHGGRW